MNAPRLERLLRNFSPRRIWRSARNLFYASPFYAYALRGQVPKTVRGPPTKSWVGDPQVGHAIVAGAFPHHGQRIAIADQPWSQPLPSAAFDQAHGFVCLRDLHAAGTEDARRAARRLVEGWIACNRHWARDTWRPDLVGERIANWLVHYVFLGADKDDAFRAALLRSVAEQARHLNRCHRDIPRDSRRFKAVRGLIYAGLSLGIRRGLDTGFKLLASEIGAQIFPDGGTAERSPAAVMAVLRALVEVRSAVLAAHIEVPTALQGAIDRMAPMLRALRHGDGALAVFNGGTEMTEGAINALLAQTGSRGKALVSAPHSGFFRIAAGRTVLIMDCGGPPLPGADERAHAGLLSFEMSVGRDRLIVNCGAFTDRASSWSLALRATAAHSTVTVGDMNAAEIFADGGIGTWPKEIGAQRRDVDRNFLIEAYHDGYRKAAGIVHRRMIYLAPDGNDVRGEDDLTGTAGKSFAVRFHLHPRVQASLAQDRTTVLLRLPSGGGWRFRVGEGHLSLEDSVYCPDGFSIRRAQQIAIGGTTTEGTTVVRWAIRREGGGKT